MSINNFLKLPIIKLIATVALLYYIFNETRTDPRSISYHLTEENIDKSLDSLKKSLNTISEAQQEIKAINNNETIPAKESEALNNDPKIAINYKDIRQGVGENQVECGSQVSIEYTLINSNNGDMINKSNMDFEVGDRFNELIEKGLIGMKMGGIRTIDIPKNFKIGDNIYDKMIQDSAMVYKVLLLKISDLPNQNAVCDE
jgi:FKBP-type peptidyl-prolyl cis-trans isomerase